MSQQKGVVLLSVIAFAVSAAFGAYIYRQFEEYFRDTVSAYDSVSGPVFGIPKISHGVSESGKLIRVYYPNGGVRLGVGNPYTIFWEYKGTNDFIISLVNANPEIPARQIVRVVYEGKKPSDTLERGIYSWRVGTLADGSIVDPSAGWKIVVADGAEFETVFDEGDNYFAIVK